MPEVRKRPVSTSVILHPSCRVPFFSTLLRGAARLQSWSLALRLECPTHVGAPSSGDSPRNRPLAWAHVLASRTVHLLKHVPMKTLCASQSQPSLPVCCPALP